MSTLEHVTLDPAFEEILRDVAADPRSSLLRVPRPEKLRGLFERGGTPNLTKTGLTVAERALVETRRAELAWLLREAAMARLIQGEGGRRYVGKFKDANSERVILDDRALREHAEACMGTETASREELTAVDLLDACVERYDGARPCVTALATAAFLLQPCDSARWIHAVATVERNEARAALAEAMVLLDNAPSIHIAACTWDLVCTAHAHVGDYPGAHEAQLRRHALPHTSAFSAMNRLAMALQAGDESDVLPASKNLSNLVSSDHPLVDDFIALILSRRGIGGWSPTPAATAIVTRWLDRIDGTSRRLLDVLR